MQRPVEPLVVHGFPGFQCCGTTGAWRGKPRMNPDFLVDNSLGHNYFEHEVVRASVPHDGIRIRVEGRFPGAINKPRG